MRARWTTSVMAGATAGAMACATSPPWHPVTGVAEATYPQEAQAPVTRSRPAPVIVTEDAAAPRERQVQATVEAGSAGRPRPERTRFGPALYVGGSTGPGAPGGYLAVVAGVHAAGWLAVEGAAGTGGAFGPAVAIGPRLFVARSARVGFSLAGFYSNNRTAASDYHGAAVTYPAASHWASLEGAVEYRTRGRVGLRLGVGWAFLLNGSDFAVAAPPATGGNRLATGVADASDNAAGGRGTAFPYARLDVFYAAPL